MTESEINALIEQKLEPLRAEIGVLRQKLGLSEPSQAPEAVSSVEETSSEEVPTEISSAAPPERADFQRFLQRGLEQEQREYTEEALEAKPQPKKGWNPFRR